MMEQLMRFAVTELFCLCDDRYHSLIVIFIHTILACHPDYSKNGVVGQLLQEWRNQ